VSQLHNSKDKKSSLLGCVLELLISTAGGRFPRAWLEPRANRILAFHPHVALRGLKAHAIPANVFGGSSNRNGFRWDEQCAVPDPGVAAFRSNQRCSVSNNERFYIL